MYFDEPDRHAIQRHLKTNGIRGCSTCGAEELQPLFHGTLVVDATDKPRVVIVACQTCGRLLFFSAPAIEGLKPPA